MTRPFITYRRGVIAFLVLVLALPATTQAGPIGSATAQRIGNMSPADRAILIQSARHPAFPAVLVRARKAGVDVSIEKHFQAVPQIFSNSAVYYLRMAQDDQFEVDDAEKSALSLLDIPKPSADQWQAAATFVNTHKNLMTMAHAAASYKLFAVPREDNGYQPDSWKFPELTSCRRVARLLTLESLLWAKSGNYAEAVNNEQKCFQVGDHASSDITMVAWLVAISIDHIGLKGMQSILAMSSGNPAVVQIVDKAVRTCWRPRLMSSLIKSEDAQMIAQVEFWSRLTPEKFLEENGGHTAQLVPDPHTFAAMMDAMNARLIGDEVSMIEIADRPYPESSKRLRAIVNRAQNCKTFDSILAKFVLPVVGKSEDLIAQDTATAAITRAACSVFIYKSKHGDYPSTLADAAPKATDPFDGKLLGYRQTANGFVVYSVGPTGKYDGGDFDSKKRHEEVFRYSSHE